MSDALGEECLKTTEVVLSLPERDFGLPTRCPPWDVKALLGHMWRGMDRLRTALAAPAPPEPDTDAVSYWRRYEKGRSADSASISRRAQEAAASFPTGRDLARSFDALWREALDAVRSEDGGRVVSTWGPRLQLEEYLKTRVLEMAVHGLDLARALSREPWVTPAGAATTREILVGLLGSDPPPALGWDDVAFIEKGTGRQEVSAGEREVLGERAGLFPLLG